jgi:hypothetical protein
MTGNVRYGYIPPDRPGPRETHRARRVVLVLAASVAAGFALGWRLGR